MALSVREDGSPYGTLHGLYNLAANWPKLYTVAQNNELPAECFAQITQGDDFGWPHRYCDAAQRKHVLAPEYGGDGGRLRGLRAEDTADPHRPGAPGAEWHDVLWRHDLPGQVSTRRVRRVPRLA